MELFFLIGVSFLTSAFTAIIGVGGGIALISVMPGLLPAAAIIPVHGAVQLASNASRVFFGFRHMNGASSGPSRAVQSSVLLRGRRSWAASASTICPCI